MDETEQQRQIEIDAARFGIPISVLKAAIGEDESGGAFGVWPENAEAVRCFIACCTQWRIVAGFNGANWTGLDYAGVDAVLRHLVRGRKRRRSRFEDIQIMEAAAMEVLNG